MSGPLLTGDEVEVEVGPVAHGGHCVARHEGQVVFVRHALPGERVRLRVTEGEEGDRFVRADAVEVLVPSPHRVTPPCPYAVPGGCGGCDWQHADLAHQRALKTSVVREQLWRLAQLESDVEVEAVPGDPRGLHWRTRVELAVDQEGRPGLRPHRSHAVLPVQDCLIATDGLRRTQVLSRRWPGRTAVDVVDPSAGEPVAVSVPVGPQVPSVTETVTATLAGSPVSHEFSVSARGFWQVHPAAATTLVQAVLDQAEVAPGDRVVDLYSGVGLFSRFLADAVGRRGIVTAVEGDRVATSQAARNLRDAPWARATRSDVARWLRSPQGARARGRTDVVILDPPRTGARRAVVRDVAALGPRRIVYVACDPAALARDTAYLMEAGWGLGRLRAFDLFPMTHHVECVASFVPAAV